MRIIGNNPNTPSQLRAIASGTLANGDPVVINSDGTVSAGVETIPQTFGSATVFDTAQSNYVSATFDSNSNKVVIVYRDDGNSNQGTAIVGTVSGTSISFGSAVVFETGLTNYISATFDSNSNKVVIAYQDSGNSGYGTAIVGTVSGTSISFGTPVTFNTGTTYVATTFDSNSNKVVIAYRDASNSNYGTAIVGTVSGTSISFGSEVVFDSSGAAAHVDITFDSNLNKVVIAYMDGGNSNYGTAIVGTVSGTSISFGSGTVFNTGTTYNISTTFDSNSNKVVIAYRDVGNSNYGTAIVGTVSGTSISFGSEVVFNSATTSTPGIAFDPNVNKVVIAYRDSGNSNYGTAIVGTVSGTSISFGSEVVFDGASYLGRNPLVFDSNSNRIVIAYKDNDNSEAGTAIVFRNATTNNNYTSENYIGIARSGATSGAGVIVDTQGAIADNLSGLTAGQSYFLADDGSLSETNNGRKIGTAVSATKLLIDTAMSGPETDAYLGGLV
jgi:phenylpyruvate tautomerase PptA (4-oxalocrotonate tautomerase family)